ncbi:MAG: hypothetical protein M1814_001896 [Vezdaea aestivalis]|nr:MAG: hypothetical protein M1814_001896 [Vezdaea aestivalis]
MDIDSLYELAPLPLLSLAVLSFLACIIYVLLVTWRGRISILHCFCLRKTHGLANTTNPSPEKEGQSGLAPEPPYKHVFPPSRRGSLADVATTLPPHLKRRISIQTNVATAVNKGSPGVKSPMSPLSALDDGFTPAFTPTEFTSAEIEALGDFPDYAQLSGVPLPKPYENFDITKAIPRPYRPLRWAYHQTMSLTKMETDWWLELFSTYKETIAQRKELYVKNGTSVLNNLPGSEPACKELMEMATMFLCSRYPELFWLSEDKTIFHNGILNNTTNLKSTHPLEVLLENVPEDFGVMLRNPDDGFYYLRAGVICSALGWSLGQKMGMQLHQIHEPIPDYKEKMQFSMDRYFSKMPTERPIQRGSWGLEVDSPLYMPPGDPHESYREYQDGSLTISRCNLRVDWQTLRRLPLSGAIIFNFKAVFTPVEKFRNEPFIPALLLKVLKEGKKEIMKYKNTWHVEHVVLPALENWKVEQVERGMVPADWVEKTLEESPYYPGWKEVWRDEQGF